MNKSAPFNIINNKETVPSRWWIIYHCWAGICVNLYLKASGLLEFVMGNQMNLSHSSASSYANSYALLKVGVIAIGYFSSKTIIKIIDSRTISNQTKRIFKFILPIIYLATAILLSIATEAVLNL